MLENPKKNAETLQRTLERSCTKELLKNLSKDNRSNVFCTFWAFAFLTHTLSHAHTERCSSHRIAASSTATHSGLLLSLAKSRAVLPMSFAAGSAPRASSVVQTEACPLHAAL